MTKDLTKGNPSKILIIFALSILTTSVLDYVYGATDSAMLSYYVDKHALGAISSILPALSLIQGVVLGLLSGFSITMSRAFGSNSEDKTKKTVANGVFLSMVIILPSMLASLSLANPIANAMNVPEEFMDDALTYFFIIVLAFPISGVSWFCSGLLRAFGDSRTPMIVSGVCGILNVAFNYLFLAVVPLGVAGAALGTVCASAVGMVAYLVILTVLVPQIRFKAKDMRPRSSVVKELLNDGITIAMLNFVVSSGHAIIQRAVNGFQPAVITGISTGSKIANLLWIIACALESALMYFCSQNVGAGKIGRIKQGIKANLAITSVSVIACAALMLLFREPLLRIFLGSSVDADTVLTLSYASNFLFTQIVFLPAIILMSCFRGTVRGLGSSIPTIACGVIELVVRVVVTAICEFSSFAQNVQINILFVAGPLAWLSAAIMLGVILPGVLRRVQDSSQKERVV